MQQIDDLLSYIPDTAFKPTDVQWTYQAEVERKVSGLAVPERCQQLFAYGDDLDEFVCVLVW